ncbi:MAG: (2Fe-2S)-binding protein, partial [Chthoniobacterales bacterium]|nr:(2Fe-2S)-binding protein [Chthoniobacterales bacterium]
MKRVALMPIQDSMLVRTGTPLLSALLAKGMNILMSCGGNGLCATCHIHVREGMEQLSPKEAREQRTLMLLANADPTSRLACQTKVLGDGVVLELPEGMYVEKMEDLLGLLGTRAPENILHPVDGRILIPKGKIITRTLLEKSRSLADEVKEMKARLTGQAIAAKPGGAVSVTICSGVSPSRQEVRPSGTSMPHVLPPQSPEQGRKSEATRISDSARLADSSRTELKKGDLSGRRDAQKLSSSTHHFSLDETKLKHAPVSQPKPAVPHPGPASKPKLDDE